MGRLIFLVPYNASLLMWTNKTHATYNEENYATRFR